MQCPACKNKLSPIQLGGVHVDVCKGGCGGIWFDQLELIKVDEKAEDAGELLSIERNPNTKIDTNKRLNCPKDDSIMMRHFFSVKRNVTVDQCPKCASFWLDAGELRNIREEFGSEEERTAAAHQYFDKEFGSRMAEMKLKNREGSDSASKIARMFRFICPSNYIPGKQKGGAF